jgi:hypothetical protein
VTSNRKDGRTKTHTVEMIGAFLREPGQSLPHQRMTFRRLAANGGYDQVYGFTHGSGPGNSGFLARDPRSDLVYASEWGLQTYIERLTTFPDPDNSPLPDTIVYVASDGRVKERPLSSIPELSHLGKGAA